MIRVEHLYKSFGDVHAVKDVSFHVKKGEVVGLLGPNGAGKTTTMRIITGFLSADHGDVYINDNHVAVDNIKTRSLVGYLPENAPLYVDMEVTDFLTYIGELRGVAKNDLLGRIEEMVDTCGLAGVAGRSIGKLSRGYKQRVGLAASLIHHPPILVLDEPTSGLDPNQIVEIRSLIKKIGEERTVVLSTHIMQEVEATCSRAFIINEGELVGSGSLKELMSQRGGETRYHLSVKAPRELIKTKSEGLHDITLVDFEGVGTDGWEKVLFHTGRKDNAGEEIFRWVVANNWSMKELHEERASLEDVFRNLTIGDQ